MVLTVETVLLDTLKIHQDGLRSTLFPQNVKNMHYGAHCFSFFLAEKVACYHALSQSAHSRGLAKYVGMTCRTFRYVDQYAIIFRDAFTLFVLTGFVFLFFF